MSSKTSGKRVGSGMEQVNLHRYSTLPWLALGSLLSMSLGRGLPAVAQSITAAPDGTQTLVTLDGHTYHIHGGTQAGANLFHSFQAFGLSAGEIANFLSQPGIDNILGRVVGGDPSVINGLLQVTGGGANLYLMNPAGIVFGPQASLNVMGDFTATTATGIQFSDGIFHAVDAPDYAQLVGQPQGFIFSGSTNGSIVNAGDLTVAAGQDLSLVGGTVLSTGSLNAPGGQITIAAVPGTSRVKISQPGSLLSIEVEVPGQTAQINPLDLPELLTGSGVATPEFSGDDWTINDGDIAIAGAIVAQDIVLIAQGRVNPTDPSAIRTHNGAETAPTVFLLPDNLTDPVAYTFIDSRADNPLALLYGGKSGTISTLIPRDAQGIDQVATRLQSAQAAGYEVDTVNVIAEGNAGNFWLGNQWLTAANIGNYQPQLTAWGDALTDSADILLYSCFTAMGAAGETLVASLADFTGADVAASTDATGSANFGGDWHLETRTGEIEAANPFTAETLATWEGKLATLTVQSAADNMITDGILTLREAIEAANTGTTIDGQTGTAGLDTIEFDTTGVFAAPQTITTVLGEFSLTNDVIIDGTGAANLILDGGGANRIFNISANTATIRNLTLQNGSVSGVGGGIYHTGNATLTLSQMTIRGNQSTYRGAGIYSHNGDVVGNSVQILNNTATGSSADGGGIFSNNGQVLLTNSIVSGNSAADRGGGIRILNGGVSLFNSQITGNTAGTDGGGVFSGGVAGAPNNGTVSVVNSTLSGNNAGRHGGAIAAGGVITLNNSTVASNVAIGTGGGAQSFNGGIVASNSTIAGNQANGRGGGLNSGSSVNLANTTVSGNITNDDGGGIFSNGALTLTNATVSGNTANDDGGGIFSNGVLNLTNATIAFNVADGDNNSNGQGGGILTTGMPSHRIVNSIIARNIDRSGLDTDIVGNFTNGDIRHSVVMETMTIAGLTPINGVNGNITGQDPLLAPLANNGGATQTHALLPGSVAIDAGDGGVASGLDQRGLGRVGTADIGAFEDQTPVPTPTPTPVPTPTPTPVPTPTTLPTPQDKPAAPVAFPDGVDPEIELNLVTLRDRVDQLLAADQLCAALETADQYQTQAFRQHFGLLNTGADLTCGEMQQQLPEDALMVSVLAQADQLHLMTISAEGDPNHYAVPVAREVVLAQVAEFQRSLTSPALRRSDRFLSSAQQLYQWLIEPLLPELQARGTRNILFSLDNGLRTLPLAALHDGKQFLVENYQATLIPSFGLTPTQRPNLHEASILAMGISQFDHLSPLPGVPVELSSIKQQFPMVNDFAEKYATLKAFTDQLQKGQHQIVHLATHGNFQPGQAENSFIQFWDDQLNLREIEQLPWSQAAVDLLVLSACQTALGDASVEYGFAGLAVQAQAGAALAGLWNAHDAATLALMSEFYRQLSLGHPKGEALQRAQIALLRGEIQLQSKQLVGSGKQIPLPIELQEMGDRSFWHPYYWSGFTLIGNPW